ncbi:hypothetical protein, partial [Mesorhizobium sp.]|uniref:hypothetical protein n=1 Tax=Mesorhizobium sp. TaxID=1871066 RepID=UPI00257C6397
RSSGIQAGVEAMQDASFESPVVSSCLPDHYVKRALLAASAMRELAADVSRSNRHLLVEFF